MVGFLGLAGEAGHQPPLHALDHRPLPIRTPSSVAAAWSCPHGAHRQVRPRRHVVRRPEPVNMERRHSGAVSTAARVGGGGGEAEGPGNLGRAEGAPGPAAHGRPDWNAFSGAAAVIDPRSKRRRPRPGRRW